MSPAFATVLASARPDFNRRFAEARHRFPDLTPERFSRLMQESGDAIVQAAEEARPGIAGEVGQVVFDAGLTLTGQRLAGPDARHGWVNAIWTQLLPELGAHVAASPGRVIAAFTNAACHLASTPGARPSEWCALVRALGPRCDSVEALLALGQVAAWRAGLAHFRAGALEAASRLPVAVALTAVEAPASADWATVKSRLLADPWYSASKTGEQGRLRLALRAGAFRGFGGLFPEPPLVVLSQRDLIVSSGGEEWLLTADRYGATFHRVDTGAKVVAGKEATSELPKGLKVGSGGVQRGREKLDLADVGAVTSAVVSADGATLAVTGDGTHAVTLVALT